LQSNPDIHAEGKSKGWHPEQWVSLVPYGANQTHPNAYADIFRCIAQNRDNLAYAWRILRDGCCDGCALGTSGLHDWTMKGIHLCNVRLELLRLNTMPGLDYRMLEDIERLRSRSEKELRQLGRLPVPMIRRKGDRGFRRISWEQATSLIADELRRIDPRRIAWYMTSRGLTNEAYYAHQKVARFIGTNNVDTSARICHAPSTSALSSTIGCAATTCSYSDWVGADLIVLVGTNLAAQFSRYSIQPGDVLFTRSGTVGRCSVAQQHQVGWLMTFHLLRARPDPEICLSDYLRIVFEGAIHIRRQTREASIGTTRAGFNTNLLANLDVPLPPIAEQRRVVAEVDAEITRVLATQEGISAAIRRADHLRQAILKRAFEGKLVRQDSNDEPASVLLERIRAERAQRKPATERTRRTLQKAEGVTA
jgi:hypothetical protein